MTIVGLKQLREHTTEIAERVARGESFMVVKRSKPIFQLTPLTSPDTAAPKHEVSEWTRDFINRHRPAFEALANE